MNPNVYTKTYSRAVHSYYANGFLARYLDAEDWDFIEHVQKCGIANGELPYTNGFVLQELDYWHMPYGIDYTVHRRVGTPKDKAQKFMIPEADAAARKAQRVRDKADREQMKKAMHEEWQRQNRDLLQEREMRLKRAMLADKEWDEANPRAASARSQDGDSFAPYVHDLVRPSGLPNRHYIPFWKREEMETPRQRKKREKQELAKKAAEEAARQNQERLQKIARQIKLEKQWAERQQELQAQREDTREARLQRWIDQRIKEFGGGKYLPLRIPGEDDLDDILDQVQPELEDEEV